jgi:hypothetical protein
MCICVYIYIAASASAVIFNMKHVHSCHNAHPILSVWSITWLLQIDEVCWMLCPRGTYDKIK